MTGHVVTMETSAQLYINPFKLISQVTPFHCTSESEISTVKNKYDLTFVIHVYTPKLKVLANCMRFFRMSSFPIDAKRQNIEPDLNCFYDDGRTFRSQCVKEIDTT